MSKKNWSPAQQKVLDEVKKQGENLTHIEECVLKGVAELLMEKMPIPKSISLHYPWCISSVRMYMEIHGVE